jgi:hypothetical protein
MLLLALTARMLSGTFMRRSCDPARPLGWTYVYGCPVSAESVVAVCWTLKHIAG